MYGAGLSVGEVSRLKLCDIDSEKMQIFIRNGKGGKDRFALLSQTNLEMMRKYYQQYRPPEWLFYSRNKTGTHINPHSVQDIFRKYKNKVGITKKVTSHTMRHSFATHLLEDGISIVTVKPPTHTTSLKTMR